MTIDDADRPSIGLEIELAAFAAGRPTGLKSTLPARVVAHAARTLPCLPRFGRSGLFTSQGLMYHEMHRLLEVATWPARDLPAALRLEDAALLQAQRVLREVAPNDPALHLVCYPDDAAGVPMQFVTANDDEVVCSRSIGMHLNVFVPGGARHGVETAMALAVALTEVVGPGGLVRRQDGGFEFWRDPRSAHVYHRTASCAHDALRPVLKLTEDARRLQVVSLGYAASRRDRAIKYGLFLLLGCHLASARGPVFRVDDVAQALHGAPAARFRVLRNRKSLQLTRGELLQLLLDEVLTPAAATPFGRQAQCDAALELAQRVLQLLRGGTPIDELARQVPLSWAIKQSAFTAQLQAAGADLPLAPQARNAPEPAPDSDAAGRADPELLGKLAVLSVLEACVLCSDVRRLLLRQVDDADWRFDDIYGRDPEAEGAVREQRLCAGAIAPSLDIVQALRSGGTVPAPGEAPLLAADWTGVRSFATPPRHTRNPFLPDDEPLAGAVPPTSAGEPSDAAATPPQTPEAGERSRRRRDFLAEARAALERMVRRRPE